MDPSSSSCLPSPSSEQQSAIDAIQAGKCLSILAVAGSGKTTTMLQIASSLPSHRRVTIVTYNRALKDECQRRIQMCGLSHRVAAFTVHGLVTRVSKRICNDDHKLNQVVKIWDDEIVEDCVGGENNDARFMKKKEENNLIMLDIVMIDEAQDLRPSFYKAICHVIRKCRARHHTSNAVGALQMCLIGDHKQLLYDFPTYGSDKASARYIQEPQQYWGQFTHPREWISTKLSTSYRLTPNIATFVNVIWGTKIVGGNTRVPNLPVEYICRYPYPAQPFMKNDLNKLDISLVSDLIDEYGTENVMLLAQSVRNEDCPIRSVVNALMKLKSDDGGQKYNFHINESSRGYEGGSHTDNLKNKVRVLTFCGSKGCEADCVVVFNLDMRFVGRIQSLNQVGVALSRAKKRLVVIHGMSYTKVGTYSANLYYPMLGDNPNGMDHALDVNGNVYDYRVPDCPLASRETILLTRSYLTKDAMHLLERHNVICLKKNRKFLPMDEEGIVGKMKEVIYEASNFNYFASDVEENFLAYASWTKECGVIDRINYTSNVRCKSTVEDVSALYGEALVYMLQWERQKFCPNVETVVYNGLLRLQKFEYYDESRLIAACRRLGCEPLSDEDLNSLRTLFRSSSNSHSIKGIELVPMLNSGFIKLKKKRSFGNRTIYFAVRAILSVFDDDNMIIFTDQLKTIYESSDKSPSNWVYLANGVLAFNEYHDKWNQIGTESISYDAWVEQNVLLQGLFRLSQLMAKVPLTNLDYTECCSNPIEIGCFELPTFYKFNNSMMCMQSQTKVVGVGGICDWIGKGLLSEDGREVDFLEIKFLHGLRNENRLQVLVYCALLSLANHRPTIGMLYNARTGEKEICSLDFAKSEKLLSDITLFKLKGVVSLDPHDVVQDTTARTIGRICEAPFGSVPPESLPTLVNELMSKIMKDCPQVSIQACCEIHNLAWAFAEGEIAQNNGMNPLIPFMPRLLGTLLQLTNVDEKNLRDAAFEAISALIQTGASNSKTPFNNLLPIILARLCTSFSVHVFTNEDKERKNDVQGLLCALIKVLVCKLEVQYLLPHADGVMKNLLLVLETKNATCHGEVFSAISVVCDKLESHFDVSISNFKFIKIMLLNILYFCN
jgi:Karyopherin (importin) beta